MESDTSWPIALQLNWSYIPIVKLKVAELHPTGLTNRTKLSQPKNKPSFLFRTTMPVMPHIELIYIVWQALKQSTGLFIIYYLFTCCYCFFVIYEGQRL